MPIKKPVNPFYVLLVLAGVAFFVTACAYGTMALREFRAPAGDAAATESGLLTILDRHGAATLGVEIAVLAVTTFAAMAYDEYLGRQEKQRVSKPE